MSGEGASLEWALCETTVTPEGVIKQRRLPDQMQNLAERISLNSRYYLKNNSRSEPLVPDDLAPEILKEAQIQLMQLNAQIVAAQLTLQVSSLHNNSGLLNRCRTSRCSRRSNPRNTWTTYFNWIRVTAGRN